MALSIDKNRHGPDLLLSVSPTFGNRVRDLDRALAVYGVVGLRGPDEAVIEGVTRYVPLSSDRRARD
jgi:hypothetical protein